MRGENGVPETPEWSLPRTSSCAGRHGICENAQHCIWLRGGDVEEPGTIVRGEN